MIDTPLPLQHCFFNDSCGVIVPRVEEAVSNRECNEPVVSKILIRQESSSDADASAWVLYTPRGIIETRVLCQTCPPPSPSCLRRQIFWRTIDFPWTDCIILLTHATIFFPNTINNTRREIIMRFMSDELINAICHMCTIRYIIAYVHVCTYTYTVTSRVYNVHYP